MIHVILSKVEFEYDVYILIKQFYPEEQININKELETENNITPTKDLLEIIMNLTEDEINVSGVKEGVILYESLDKVTLVNSKEYKNQWKRSLYKLLSTISKKELPWGILTGVRPTKLALEPYEQGIALGLIEKRFRQDYLCSEDKTKLALEVAKREFELLKSIDYKNSYSIYIGIPFCPSTCLYCSFTSYSIDKMSNMVELYLEALKKEITYAKTAFPKKIATIYIGGGTPTSLSEEQLEDLLYHIHNTFDTTKLMEYTVEAGRPDSITIEKLRLLKKYGVSRISINPQTMVQRTLDVIGRKHSVEDVIQVFQEARDLGHSNINMDIIIGLPGENINDVEYTLKEIDKLKPDSLTVHTLAIKRAARLNLEKDNYQGMASTDGSKMLEITSKYSKEQNYLPYYLYRQKNMTDNLENIGYAQYGKEGIYNILIMEEKQTILALGAGALSKFVFHDENRLERVENVKSLKDYIERIDEMIERKKRFLHDNQTKLERNF